MASQGSTNNELYNLRWNSYNSNLINVFNDHQKNEALVDVTISCETKFLKAHRLILSASSVYFQKIFEVHKDPQMIIILNDAKFADLQLLIQFIYSGEVKVADAQLQSFLALGRLLQVKGLSSVQLHNSNKKIAKVSLEETKNSETNPKNSEANAKSSQNNASAKSPTKDGNKEKITLASALETLPVPKLTLIDNRKRKLESPTSTPPVSPPSKNSAKKKSVPKTNNQVSQSTSTSPPESSRPPNAFMIFANQWRKKLAVEYPNDTNKDISVKLGNMWKSLSQDTREGFYEDARRAAEDHKVKYPGYYKAGGSNAKKKRESDSSRDPGEKDIIEIKAENMDVGDSFISCD